MRSLVRVGAAGLALCAGLGALSACTSEPRPSDNGHVPLGSYTLVSFDTCADALAGLRTAAKASVGPYGLGFGDMMTAGGGAMRGEPVPAAQPGGAQPGAVQPAIPPAAAGQEAEAAKTNTGTQADGDYSGTNTHEAGVDEPDLVKTDGRRIVTVSGSTLKVIDAASRKVTSTIDLRPADGSIGDDGVTDRIMARYVPDELLLSGDHALVLLNYSYRFAPGVAVAEGQAGGAKKSPTDTQSPIAGPKLVLVSLTGAGQILSSVTADGSLVDARQVGSTVRVVLRSTPRVVFPYSSNGTEEERITSNRAIIDQAPIEQWLPRIETTTGATTRPVNIDCSAISRPADYTATNFVTVLSFDLGVASLGDGRPTTLVADGDTVYSTGSSLYVASSRRFTVRPQFATGTVGSATTEIYRFDTSSQRPTFAAGGVVPGYLINQYAMSEWDGRLRVATTTPATAPPGVPEPKPATPPNAVSGSGAGSGTSGSKPGAVPASTGSPSSSTVYVLAQDGKALTQVGSVGGLGKGEQIYAVRFVGPTAYVVTFRQTDPLYTVDLHDPAKPVVRGELKIPGYSAYLHPAGDNKLIGVGQSATDQGRVKGTQVSLFDVGNLASPGRLAQYTLSGAHSEAEFDPHAFLYWPATGLVVVPLQQYSVDAPRPAGNGPAKVNAEIGALALRVSGDTIQEVGFIQHPSPAGSGGYPPAITRSLVIGTTLWTVSDAGLLASDLNSLSQQAWIPLR